MHQPITTIENSTQIAIAPDGSPLRTWTEENGSRSFVEVYVYFTATSGQVYGAVNVLEIG